MQLKEILRHHLEKERYKYKLSSNSNFYYVEEEQFYIEPDFYKISNTEQIDNIKFILFFSARCHREKCSCQIYIL